MGLFGRDVSPPKNNFVFIFNDEATFSMELKSFGKGALAFLPLFRSEMVILLSTF